MLKSPDQAMVAIAGGIAARTNLPVSANADRFDYHQALGKVFIRAERRDNLRAVLLACTTPLPDARCISGCAARSASLAADLSPLAIASSTFLTKVRMRDFRAWLRAVRVKV